MINLQDKIFSVTEFNDFFDIIVSSQQLVVAGEISEISLSQGRWLFITIKDSEAQVEVFAVADNISTISILKEGLLVHIYGTPHIYKKSGRFRITAQQILPAGEGELKIAFELLKLKLEKEGIFALERKRQIPKYPAKIALLTAENSQAYHDFIKIIKDRTGGIEIYFFPIAVQGANSVSSIVKSIRLISEKYKYLDLLVLTRGGGSLEDLQAFNSEEVARAIFTSKIPVISAVGHENDITLSDLAADLRASTPTNAAEIIAREKEEIIRQLNYTQNFLTSTILYKLSEILGDTNRALSIIESKSKEIDITFEKEKNKLTSSLLLYLSSLESLTSKSETLDDSLNINSEILIKKHLIKIGEFERLVKSLNYENVLKRGFSLTLKKGKIIRSIKNIQIGDNINIVLSDGGINSSVKKITNEQAV